MLPFSAAPESTICLSTLKIRYLHNDMPSKRDFPSQTPASSSSSEPRHEAPSQHLRNRRRLSPLPDSAVPDVTYPAVKKRRRARRQLQESRDEPEIGPFQTVRKHYGQRPATRQRAARQRKGQPDMICFHSSHRTNILQSALKTRTRMPSLLPLVRLVNTS